MAEVKRVNAEERAKMIAARISGKTEETTNKRTEIQSREKGFRPVETTVAKQTNIISSSYTPRINAADFARELRLRKEKEYSQR